MVGEKVADAIKRDQKDLYWENILASILPSSRLVDSGCSNLSFGNTFYILGDLKALRPPFEISFRSDKRVDCPSDYPQPVQPDERCVQLSSTSADIRMNNASDCLGGFRYTNTGRSDGIASR